MSIHDKIVDILTEGGKLSITEAEEAAVKIEREALSSLIVKAMQKSYLQGIKDGQKD